MSPFVFNSVKILFGESSSTEWFERMRNILLSEGLGGVERELSSLKADLKESQIKLVDSLLEDFRNNAHRLNYGSSVELWLIG